MYSFLSPVSHTKPDYLLNHICIVHEKNPLRSVLIFWEPITIDHNVFYSWIYLTDTSDSIVIKLRLYIVPYSIFSEFLLFRKLPRWVSFSNILFEYICSTRKIFMFSLLTSNETKKTLFALQFRTSTLIFPIFLQVKRTAFRTFFLP